MDILLQNTGFTALDLVAVLFLLSSWVLHYWIVNFSPLRVNTISYRMNRYRQKWMDNMVFRDPKMPDTLIQNTLQYGVLFYASTSILLVGALGAGLGASDQAVKLLADLPFVTNTSRTAWEIKVFVVIFIFTFAFFKFAWSYRLFSYVIILIGAAPDISVVRAKKEELPTDDSEETQALFEQQLREGERFAKGVGQLHSLGARHFTTGVNAYFFALAASVWFLDPRLLIGATIWVSVVLYRRAFRSNFMKILGTLDP
ncbi:hypothetical protein AB833_05655 [Chromatiales bacterium (ex Bugula neritina AB1)]|nr:hypothetical protein AB833_05655 [Chromatiales bacterium (ex Bugula neritina AB1)]